MNEYWHQNILRSEVFFTGLLAVVIAQLVVLAQDNRPYTTYSSFNDLMAGKDGPYPKLVRVSDPGKKESPNYTGFFFYQCQQFDPTDRYILGMRVHCQNRGVRPTDRAEIGLIDLQDGFKWIRIGDTTAWNWQQGARLQWRPGSNEILWNDRSDDGRRYICRVYDFKTGARRTLPRPVYMPAPDGDFTLTHDFERMKHGGTPYVGIKDKYADQYAPKKTGIWKMDLNTGETELIMSLYEMARIAYPGGAPSSGCLYFFREGWNPSGSRFIAFVKDPYNNFDKAFSLRADGTDVRYLYNRPSHHEWQDDESVLDGRGYYLYPDDGTGKTERRLFESPHNGHVSYIPRVGGDWIISDTYAIKGYQYLFLYHIRTRQFVPLAKLISTAPKYTYRVDLHPRLSRSGRTVSIDTTHEGLGRQMYLMDIGYILDNPPDGILKEQQSVATESLQSNVVANLQREKVVKFTFGTPTSVTRTGFVKVTVNDAFKPQKGYGFQSTKELLAYDRGGSEIVRPKDEYTASVYGAYRTTSDLTCALVEGTRDNTFVVALPDGEYTVWLIAGDAECDPPLFEVWANGHKKLDVRIPRRAFVFMESFQASATEGRLRIEFKGSHGWIMNGLVIGQEGPGLAEVITKVERDIFFLTEQELPNWHEVKSEPANPPLDWSTSEKQRGYMVFPVDYTELVTPTFVPARKAIAKPLTAFATPGEFEPATFCIFSHKELGHVKIELSDFVSDKTKQTIARENVKVGVVRCWPQRVSGWGGKGEYYIVPEMIEPPSARASRMQAGQLKQWWLTVHVPLDTPAGRYRMSLTVRPEKAPPSVLQWRLLVLPFQLSRPADKHWGTWLDSFPPVGSLWGPERRGRKTPAEVERLAKADIADYRAHGFDLALLNYYFGVKENPDGSFTYGLSTLEQDMEYLKQLGSDAPVVICFEYTCRNLEYGFAEPGKKHVPGTFSTKAHKAIVGLVQHIQDEAKRRNWPKIYFFPIDEPGNNKTENRYLFAENVLDFVHEVPGCQTAVTVTSGCVRRLGDRRVDVRIYAYGHYNRDKVLQEAKQGHPFWYYENGMFYGHSTFASRCHTGFEFLRSGAEVATAWGFAATQANPHNDFDGGHKDWNVIFPGVDKPTPTIYWELCREGVDDCRYVTTLQEHIQQVKKQGAIKAAQRAQRVLDPLVSADAPAINNPLAFGRYRWRIAREILALRGDEQSLPFAAVAENPPRPVKLGPNLVGNPSFEEPLQADGSPPGSYHLGYPTMKEKPVGALKVTDEVAHSGRFSLKWDLSKVADPEYKGRHPRWLTVNVGFSRDAVKSLRGKRVRVGYWMRLGGGTTVPGLGLRQYLKAGPGEGFYYRGGVDDPAVWNHFVAEGRLSNNLDSMDIHTWCSIPEVKLAKNCFFYIDDVSLEVIEEPPLSVTTPLDEYYIGETIPWIVSITSASGEIKIALLAGEQLVEEQTHKAMTGSLRGKFESRRLIPGIYTLQAKTSAPPQAWHTAQRQIILTPNPWE